MAHVLGWSRARLLAEHEYQPDAAQVAAFQQLLARRRTGAPVAYLVGQRAFFGFDVLVDPRVLVPRPETEVLVEVALALLAAWRHPQPLTIADIGTGSGAIALALALHLPHAHIYATDLSPAALEVARLNVQHRGVGARVHLLQGDLLEPLPHPVDVIISNPPYTILATIAANVRQHEPHLALDGGPDGLHLYRRLLAQVPAWLRPGGLLLLEIGATQAPPVATLVRAALPAAAVRVHTDLAGWERVVVAELPPNSAERRGGGSRPGDPG